MALFSLQLKQQEQVIAESYYEISPEPTPEELKKLEDLALSDPSAKSTNQAFNEEEEFKDVMKNFRTVASEKFDAHSMLSEVEATEETTEDNAEPSDNTADNAVNADELASFSKINAVIAKRSPERRKAQASNGDNSKTNKSVGKSVNTNSSVSFSLVNRTDKHLPPPVYLCEEGGKIVVNITVNAEGLVTDTYVNSSSTSRNACLVQSALEYAQNARFSTSNTQSKQIGTITYYFKGKN